MLYDSRIMLDSVIMYMVNPPFCLYGQNFIFLNFIFKIYFIIIEQKFIFVLYVQCCKLSYSIWSFHLSSVMTPQIVLANIFYLGLVLTPLK